MKISRPPKLPPALPPDVLHDGIEWHRLYRNFKRNYKKKGQQGPRKYLLLSEIREMRVRWYRVKDEIEKEWLRSALAEVERIGKLVAADMDDQRQRDEIAQEIDNYLAAINKKPDSKQGATSK